MPSSPPDIVVELLRTQIARSLDVYRHNLALAMNIVENGWLPEPDDPNVQQHLETLRQYMARIGQPEHDLFLLRLGLSIPGMQRGKTPPIIVLDPNRGGFSERRQGEAQGHIEYIRNALVIGRQLVPNLPADTQQAVAQLAALSIASPANRSPEQLHKFAELTDAQAHAVADHAIILLNRGAKVLSEIGTDVLQKLACFRNAPLTPATCQALIDRRVFWPPSMYANAGDEVAERLIHELDEPTHALERNHLLLALAWTRSAAAARVFRDWSNSPPIWSRQLQVPIVQYCDEAAWTLDEHGEPRDLASMQCFCLRIANDSAKPAIPCRTPLAETCRACNSRLAWLFDFSHVEKNYFPGELAEAPRKILCCLQCACYSPFYSTYRPDGSSECSAGNEGPPFETEPQETDSCTRTLDPSPAPPLAASATFELDDASSLGGLPMLMQDARYPRCITCDRLMTFFAQHDNGPLSEEGIYYAHFCARCHAAAVTYQQT